MNILDVTKQFLEKNGYDGLCNEDCSCLTKDLAPCGIDFSKCNHAYRVKCSGCSEFDYCLNEDKIFECPNEKPKLARVIDAFLIEHNFIGLRNEEKECFCYTGTFHDCCEFCINCAPTKV